MDLWVTIFRDYQMNTISLLPASHHIKIRNALIACLALLLLVCLPQEALAQVSGGLQRSVTILEQLKEWAWLIIPIVCLISGGVAGVLYSMDVIRKDTLYTWIGGTVFAGLIAAGVVELVF